MNMAQNAGGMNAANLFAMGNTNNNSAQSSENNWKCECGVMNTGKFCSQCGKPKPEESSSWQCECGAVNNGNFCSQCGKPKKSAYKCSNCGWESSSGAAPKFCPQCGKAF